MLKNKWKKRAIKHFYHCARSVFLPYSLLSALCVFVNISICKSHLLFVSIYLLPVHFTTTTTTTAATIIYQFSPISAKKLCWYWRKSDCKKSETEIEIGWRCESSNRCDYFLHAYICCVVGCCCCANVLYIFWGEVFHWHHCKRREQKVIKKVEWNKKTYAETRIYRGRFLLLLSLLLLLLSVYHVTVYLAVYMLVSLCKIHAKKRTTSDKRQSTTKCRFSALVSLNRFFSVSFCCFVFAETFRKQQQRWVNIYTINHFEFNESGAISSESNQASCWRWSKFFNFVLKEIKKTETVTLFRWCFCVKVGGGCVHLSNFRGYLNAILMQKQSQTHARRQLYFMDQ